MWRFFYHPNRGRLWQFTERQRRIERSHCKNPDQQSFDINGDKKPDIWKYYRRVSGKQVLDRKEYDLNFDGKPDVVRRFNDKGQLIADALDIDFDSVPDVKTAYENNNCP